MVLLGYKDLRVELDPKDYKVLRVVLVFRDYKVLHWDLQALRVLLVLKGYKVHKEVLVQLVQRQELLVLLVPRELPDQTVCKVLKVLLVFKVYKVELEVRAFKVL